MSYFILILGLIIAGVGVFGIALPAAMTGMIVRVRWTDGLRYLAAGVRITVAAALYLAADQTRFPLALQILAGFTLFSGIAVLFIHRDRLQRWMDMVSSWPRGALRGICLIALALGGFLVLAAV